MPGIEIKIHAGSEGLKELDDNADVEVLLPDGRRFGATFFTRANLDSILARYRETGECESGLYFWARDMILVDRLTRVTVEQTVLSLIRHGELEDAFSLLDEG
ncbi:MAG: hypothetical protein MI919_42360 [Holophagales bacterium]|nr:hypothetical protein [Holophagales bacterium]